MKITPTNKSIRFLTGAALVAAITSTLYAQEKPYSQPGVATPVPPPAPPKAATTPDTKPATAPPAPEPRPIDRVFNGKLPEALAKGKFNVNARLRFEHVDQSTFDEEANAFTIRSRFGYTTAPFYGFQGMVEGENVTNIGSDDNYNAAGSNQTGDRPIIADPETTEVNQAWMSYSYTNWITAKGGRQRIALDNHRFIGDVGWRQNMQTYDAATLESKPLPDLSLFYGYLWEVNRVFGDVDGLPLASPNRDFDSDSHLFNVSYSGLKLGRLVGYTYLLDLENRAGTANSSATYGGYFAGSSPISDRWSLGYRAEAAWQTEYADSPLDYGAEYYNVELSASVKPVSFGAGYEVLGTGRDDNSGGSVGFKTPLATLHAFNGWADVFLTTPAKGLRDLYGFAQVVVPWEVPIRLIYHKFDADSGGADFGQEIDLQASKKLGKNWTVLAKYSYYDGKEAPARFDMHKIWGQVEFNF
jgi:hypothetical protein